MESVQRPLFFLRRVVLAVAPRFANRRFAFAIATVALLGAKLVHISAHLDAVQPSDLLRWGLSFFLQDTVVLLLLRVLFDHGACVTALAVVATAILLTLAGISITFIAVTGSELQWRNVTVAGDSSSWKMLLTGLVSLSVTEAALLTVAALLQVFLYVVAGTAVDVLRWPLVLALRVCRCRRPRYAAAATHDDEEDDDDYERLERHEFKHASENSSDADGTVSPWEEAEREPALASSRLTSALRVFVGLTLAAQLLCFLFRPSDASLSYLSWTLPLMPLAQLSSAAASLTSLLTLSSNLDNRTALTDPVPFAWLPAKGPLPGFEDWYQSGETHYNASADPLKLTNLDDDLLSSLRGRLADVPIRHVMLVKLESTRKDVFPVKRDGVAWERLSNTFKDKKLPESAVDRFATLTANARFITGDNDDGLADKRPAESPSASRGRARGGLNVNNCYTTSTYTLKSLAGTHCGISPLAADFNLEESHHIYQPCLPHIFNAFNNLSSSAGSGASEAAPSADGGSPTTTPPGKRSLFSEDKVVHPFASYKWKSAFMQSTTTRYDKQDRMMPQFGFPADSIIDWWYLQDAHKFPPVNITDVNYYGMPEVAIEDYLRDAFASAQKNDERLFLSHLTSTTHHAFGMPAEEKYVPLSGDKEWDDLSHYLNAVGYVDRWLGRILDILEAEGVANETLVIFVGDHGLSIAERGSFTPYSNPHVGNYHVPLVLSHPKLPVVDVNDAVVSLQILPTILDLLVETGSLDEADAAAARALARNYEGQSLIRPLRKFSDRTGHGDWQITVMNPGGSTIAVRDARRPNWRLIVPVYGNYEWRFTDLENDPHEMSPVLSFDFDALINRLKKDNGEVTAKWAEEAASVTRWWAEENYRRWRYKS
ncbi:hypothetical protein RJ55_06343 [Drechmeria coniospora]|nr:hypothetical protein RJ55_06343 [Drechmeria coniospora]